MENKDFSVLAAGNAVVSATGAPSVPAERSLPQSDWQPIRTAPKSQAVDGRERPVYLLGFVPDEHCDPQSLITVIWWESGADHGRGSWCTDVTEDVSPSHWMHLPTAPFTRTADKEQANG